MTVRIRNEMRVNDDGEPEVWTNLGDLLDWLADLPNHARINIAAGVALEIREMLLQQFDTAEVVQKGGS